ncbi:fumarylacetoacetate hydrolase family protein [Cognatishimia maritima]|uniref:Fumarylpyruvate hydrolase n=1 Tax=Cognatishimia maritima TaxID=870908 RepID=A0A1M5V1H0_9RHOB|nr:fumarylacetoacetate hydrolase family protein [Cognatishimia maritima]SHH68948.1 fumarylpyruvate hydrolase [Cognatishimia maritima]
MPDFVIPAPATPVIQTSDGRDFPVRRVYCIGRNFAAHAVEMGHDPDREPPFFFQKNPNNLTTGGVFPYPSQSADVHHEVELLVALKSGGRDIPEEQALACVWGYATCLDMTRRDLQAQAKSQGRPWEVAKAFEHSAPVGPLQPASDVGHPQIGAIRLIVNDLARQSGDLSQMIWKTPQIIAYLSQFFELAAGDVILTGTPSGVGPVVRGDRLIGEIGGLMPLQVDVV